MGKSEWHINMTRGGEHNANGWQRLPRRGTAQFEFWARMKKERKNENLRDLTKI